MQQLKNSILLIFSIQITVGYSFSQKKNSDSTVLIFANTNGYRHASIDIGIEAIKTLGRQYDFGVDITIDSLSFNDTTLSSYAAVIFLNTSGNILGKQQKESLVRFIQSGKGFVGIHAATTTEYEWPWYNQLIGAQFLDHPEQQRGTLLIKDTSFIATKHLPKRWTIWEEWYNFKNTYWDNLQVVIQLDETSIQGGKNGSFHPMAWYHSFDGGRSFYTALGHTHAIYDDTLFLQHLAGGINYAIGRVKN